MRTQNRAFTLIELLVVIAIIAILAAILFPVFAQAREKARGISCLSNEKQLALGVLMYVQDYDETFPRYWYPVAGPKSDVPFTPSEPDTLIGWNEAIYPYVKNVQLFRCPDSPRASTLVQGADGSTFGNDDSAPTGATGYSINARLTGDTSFLDNTGNLDHPSLGDGALEFPAVTILMSEASSYCSDGCASSDENEWGWEGRHVDKLYGDGWDYGSSPNSSYITAGKPVLARHTGGANYAFSDGHVKFLSAGAMGQMNPPGTNAQAEMSAAKALGFTNPMQPNDSNTGQRPTYCPGTACQYNVPPTP